MQISKLFLKQHYIDKKLSVPKIALKVGVSENKINYWIAKYGIPKRNISDAIYIKNNPNGDPFKEIYPRNIEEAILYGMGLGLYWGEGNRKNRSAIRLGNVDPKLIRTFINFLVLIFNIKKEKLKFGLQIFSDINPKTALHYWLKNIRAKKEQFQKVVITPVRSKGTYMNKSQYGVLTVHFNNVKLRNLIVKKIESFGSL